MKRYKVAGLMLEKKSTQGKILRSIENLISKIEFSILVNNERDLFGNNKGIDSKKIEYKLMMSNSCYKTKRNNELGDHLRDLNLLLIEELDESSERKVSEKSWNYIIQHFARHDHFESCALFWFESIMKNKRVASANHFTLNSMLKPLSNKGDVQTCEEIVSFLISEKKFNMFTFVYYVNACIKNGMLEKSVKIISEMKLMQFEPNHLVYGPILQECSRIGRYELGMKVCEMINSSSCQITPQLSMSLIVFFMKINHPEMAIEECLKLKRNEKLDLKFWTCLIKSYIQKGDIHLGIDCIFEMIESGVSPDSKIFIVGMKACADKKLLEEGKKLHKLANEQFVKKGFSIELATCIINFYTKCGKPEIAIEECRKLKKQGKMDIVVWTCLIQSYLEIGLIDQAIESISEMQESNIELDSTLVNVMLQYCTKHNLYEKGMGIHQQAIKCLEFFSIQLTTSIINFYTKCGHPEIALEQCREFRKKGNMDLVLWNCFIQVKLEMNDINGAIELLNEMKETGLNPDSTTYSILITACANKKLFELGNKLVIDAKDSLNNNFSIELITSMINFFIKCGKPEIALMEYGKIQREEKNVVLSTCIIQAKVEMNDIQGAFQILHEMKENGLKPDSTVLNILITACANNQLFDEGKQLISSAKDRLRKEFSVELATSIINFYTKCGKPEIAIEECSQIKREGKMSSSLWTTLIQAHISREDVDQAFVEYNIMKESCVPDKITFIALLAGFAEFVAFDKGIKVIQDIKELNLDQDEEIKSVMALFYSKSGDNYMAQVYFTEIIESKRKSNEKISLTIYNNMLASHAAHGQGQKAMELLNEMIENNVELNDQSFTSILAAYSHSGMIAEARELFETIKSPLDFHIGAIVDVYSQAGLFEEALLLIGERKNFVMWNTVMGACRKFNNVVKRCSKFLQQ